MMAKIPCILLLISFGFLISCDPETGDFYFVDNKSDYEILVNYKTWQPDTMIIVPPENKQLIYSNSEFGTAYDAGDNFLIHFDTISFAINDSLKIDKDYQSRENWDFSITGGDGWLNGGLANYTFVIDNNSIVKIDQ